MLTDTHVNDRPEALLPEADLEYSRTVTEIKDETLRQIGQDLHDSIGQLLTGIAFMVKGLEKTIISRLPEENDNMIRLRQIVEETIDQVSHLEKILNPVNIKNRGLILTLRELAVNTEKFFGIHCTFKCNLASRPYNYVLSKQLYRIAQEAVTNAIKHGDAKNISINLEFKPEISVLIVESDGLGFPENYGRTHIGTGLKIMKYRTKIIGGSICIQKGMKNGTIVTCKYPTSISKA